MAFTKAVLELHGDRCWMCGGKATTADHIIARSIRPDLAFDLSNAKPACVPCNSSRGNKPAPHHDALAVGW